MLDTATVHKILTIYKQPRKKLNTPKQNGCTKLYNISKEKLEIMKSK